jgi:sulfide:quinone oxidoreductase
MPMADFKAVVCGAGIAGVEGVLRLRRLAGDRLDVTLVSPDSDFVCRPLAVLEPFALETIRRYPLNRIVEDTDARWITDRVARVDLDARTLVTDAGQQLAYDALLLALGAGESSPYEHADVFTDRDPAHSFQTILRDVEQGSVSSVAFVIPNWPVWPLPLYELALMTAQRAHGLSLDVKLTFITAEGRPLKAFGQAAGDAIVGLLADAGIELVAGVLAAVPAPGVVSFGERRLETERVVTLPRVTGPAVPGIPAGPGWFVPIDERCVVPDSGGRAFAAGDATDYPVKHGGIGAQQADTAAAGIAHLAGIGERPPPLQPVLRSVLLTGDGPLYLMARVVDGLGWRSEVHEQPPWPAEHKVIAEELGPYLATLDTRDENR